MRISRCSSAGSSCSAFHKAFNDHFVHHATAHIDALCFILVAVISADTLFDCLLVACMRRLQGWSYISVIAEYRHMMWPTRMFDFEQLIETFDPAAVNCSSSMPDCLLVHSDAQVGCCYAALYGDAPADGATAAVYI